MQLEANTVLGPYRILAPLGAGGMGEVYKARDEKLDRNVAVKVLPARLASEPQALTRFEREAKAVAALSHPNILAIHDFGQAAGRHYVAMELLEGQTLRELLAGDALPAKKAAEYGRQIADGLAAAHGKGIVHRDLKPENLFVTRGGLVKILDFGLVKQIPTADDQSDTSSPTLTRGTEPGTVMGTAGYMAPEQVRGEDADHRADIFAFGAVLHEMLSGRRAFERATGAETMTAILREAAPPLTSLRADVPPTLERVVEHCLEKRPEDRFQSARDLSFALGGATSVSGATSAPAVVATPRRRRSGVATGALAGLLLGVVAGALLQRQLAAPTAIPGPRQARYLTYAGTDYSPAASPDGGTVAFRSDRDGRSCIWVKQLAGGTEVALTDGPLDDMPQFSPDGSMVLFTRMNGARPSLYRVPLLGGEPRRVVDDATDAAWSPDGDHIAFVRLHPAAPGKIAASSLMVAASDGGSARVIVRLEAAAIVGPRWSPDGSKIAITVSRVGAGSVDLQLVDVDSGVLETVVSSSIRIRPWSLTWTPSASLVYTGGQVSVSTLASATGRLISLDPTTLHTVELYSSPDSLGRVAALGNDRFVFEAQNFRENVAEWSAGEGGRRISHGRAADRQPVYSPDGEWIVFSSDRTGNLDLWATSSRTGELRQLTDDPADDWDPTFAPDGRLIWSSNRSGHFEIWSAESDGSGARRLTDDGVDAENPDVSPDGRWLVYGSTRPGEAGIWKVRTDGKEASLLVAGLVGIPEISPDGRYVLYLGFGANLSGSNIRVARLADGEPVDFTIALETIRVTSSNLGRARWTADGRIAFLGQDETGTNGVFVQDFSPSRDTSGTRRKLAGFESDVEAETFDLSPDGSRVAIAARDMVSSLVLLEGLDRQMP